MAFGKKTGGRKPGALNKSRQLFVDVLTRTPKKEQSKFRQVIDKQFELSQGIYVEKEIPLKDGTVFARVYKREPDQRAGQFLVEQVIGKATQAIEVTDPSDKFDAGKYLTA